MTYQEHGTNIIANNVVQAPGDGSKNIANNVERLMNIRCPIPSTKILTHETRGEPYCTVGTSEHERPAPL
jgi:hypothetical protein